MFAPFLSQCSVRQILFQLSVQNSQVWFPALWAKVYKSEKVLLTAEKFRVEFNVVSGVAQLRGDDTVFVYTCTLGKNLPNFFFGRKHSNNKIIMVKKPFFRRYNKVRNTFVISLSLWPIETMTHF